MVTRESTIQARMAYTKGNHPTFRSDINGPCCCYKNPEVNSPSNAGHSSRHYPAANFNFLLVSARARFEISVLAKDPTSRPLRI